MSPDSPSTSSEAASCAPQEAQQTAQANSPQSRSDIENVEMIPLSDITYNAQNDEFVQYSTSSDLIPYNSKTTVKRATHYNPVEWKLIPDYVHHLKDGSCVRQNGDLYSELNFQRITWCWPSEHLPMLHGFSKLPIELRRLIVSKTLSRAKSSPGCLSAFFEHNVSEQLLIIHKWKHLLPEPQMISMWHENGEFRIEYLDATGSDPHPCHAPFRTLHTCRESRTVFLENYNLIYKPNETFYNVAVPEVQFKFGWPDGYLSYVVPGNIGRKTPLGNDTDTLLIDVQENDFQNIDLEKVLSQTPFDFTRFSRIAFHGPSVYPPDMLQLLSKLVAHIRGRNKLLSVDFILGSIDSNNWHLAGHYELFKVDDSFMNLQWKIPPPNLGGWYRDETPRNRRKDQKKRLIQAQDINSELKNLEVSDNPIWRGIKTSVSIFVKVYGAKDWDFHSVVVGLVPRNPKYADICYDTEVSLREARPASIYKMASLEINDEVACQSSGTPLSSYDDYTGLSNMLSNRYEPQKDEGWIKDELRKKMEGMLGVGSVSKGGLWSWHTCAAAAQSALESNGE